MPAAETLGHAGQGFVQGLGGSSRKTAGTKDMPERQASVCCGLNPFFKEKR